ncbi:MAG: hypothetical protein ACOC8D_00655 [bacterium]
MAAERVAFHRGFELSWRDVVRLEDQLLAFLLSRDLPVARRLLACRRLVHRFLDQASGAASGTRVGVEPDEVLAGSASASAASALSGLEGALLRLLAATFLSATLPSFRELSVAGRLGVRLGNVSRRLRLAVGRGRVRLPGLEAAVPVAEVGAVSAQELSVPASAMLERYYVAKVASQGFFGANLFGRSFLAGVDFLASSYGAILWFARAHALASGRGAVAAEDVDYAIRQVDYGFNYVPAFGGRLDRLRATFFRGWGTEEKLLLEGAREG